jgi:poly(3-hydroxybutyrate) depolymerase
LCTGIPKTKRQHYEVEGAGHYGIFSGRRWRDMVYPVVKAFILSNNGQASAAAKAPRAAVTKTGKAAAPAKSTRRRSA